MEASGAGMALGLPAKMVVPLPLQNSPHLVHPCQGPICWWWWRGSVDMASIFRADGVFMELASAWMRFAVSLPVLQAELPGLCLLSPDSRLAQAA